MLNKTIAISTICIAALLLVAGCGSSGSDQLDKEGYVAQAEAICTQASKKLSLEVTSAIARQANAPERDKTQTQIAMVKSILVPSLKDELKELRALGMPSEGEQEVQAFLAASQKLIHGAEKDPVALNEMANPYEAMELAGRRYGISSCPITGVESS